MIKEQNFNDNLQGVMVNQSTDARGIVGYESGMVLGATSSSVDLELATDVDSEIETIDSFNCEDGIDNILITVTDQIDSSKPVDTHKSAFIYLVQDKAKSNLAFVIRTVMKVEETLVM